MTTPELGEVELLAVHPDIVTGQRDGAGGLWEEERDSEEGKRQERENRRLHGWGGESRLGIACQSRRRSTTDDSSKAFSGIRAAVEDRGAKGVSLNL